MLKRKDLAKEFELVVQQEIKNHNESILNTNIAINVLRQSLDKSLEEITKIAARFESRFKTIERDFENIKSESTAKFHKLSVALDNHENSTNRFSEYVSKELDRIEGQSVEEDVFKEENSKINLMIDFFKETLNKHKEFLVTGLHRIKADSQRIFEDFKKELSEKPDELWEVKAKLENDIKAVSIDGAGILRELQVYKKEVFVLDKKIEELYNKIDRINRVNKPNCS